MQCSSLLVLVWSDLVLFRPGQVLFLSDLALTCLVWFSFALVLSGFGVDWSNLVKNDLVSSSKVWCNIV